MELVPAMKRQQEATKGIKEGTSIRNHEEYPQATQSTQEAINRHSFSN
jgi:hypothetical protein